MWNIQGKTIVSIRSTSNMIHLKYVWEYLFSMQTKFLRKFDREFVKEWQIYNFKYLCIGSRLNYYYVNDYNIF